MHGTEGVRQAVLNRKVIGFAGESLLFRCISELTTDERPVGHGRGNGDGLA
jgi:hypothetical protein